MNAADELRALAAKWANADPLKEVAPTFTKAALNIKQAAAADFGGSKAFGKAAGQVAYEAKVNSNSLEFEIGAKHGPGNPGSFAAIAYYGAAHGGGGSVTHINDRLQEEIPALEEYIDKALSRLWSGA